MSQTKWKLPSDVRQQVLALVKGYNRRLKRHQDERQNIIERQPFDYAEILVKTGEKKDGTPIIERGLTKSEHSSGQFTDQTWDKFKLLDKLDKSHTARELKAVEQARVAIGVDLNEEQRQLLMTLILESCLYGREFQYEYRRGNLFMEKSAFYDRRREYLYRIAENLDLI